MSEKIKKPIRIAILYDDFSTCGGGERLVAILAKELSKKGMEADIITYDIGKDTKRIIPRGIKIKTIINKKYPFQDEKMKKYLFSQLDLTRDYDLFIFSGHSSLFASKINKPNMVYCHNIKKPASPEQEKFEKELEIRQNLLFERIWMLFYTAKNKITKKRLPKEISERIDAIISLSKISSPLKIIKYILGPCTYEEEFKKEFNHIQKIITNSINVKNDIYKHYGRKSAVIYPPVETKKFHYKKHKNFWISVNRIEPLKRIELQLKAFSKMPKEKCYIIGHIQNKLYYEYLKKIKPKNVKFLKVVNEKELIKKLNECKGMIFTAIDEDFGMAPVEAMASGKPVIAPNEGGCKETIINGKTGILIDNINEGKIVRAVEKINKNPERYKDACIKQAKKFDTKVFIKKIKSQIK